MSEIELSDDQQKCYKQIMDWITAFKHPEESVQRQDLLTMGGFAGTGKTTLIGKIRSDLKNYKIAFCAYTGKAASVLRSKLKMFNGCIKVGDYCGTIHSLIYAPNIDPQTKEIIGWMKNESLSYDLIICDEASMIGEEIFTDLSSFGIPILAIGDHGQLPPIDPGMNLMDQPDIKLEKIHRHAENSPIIKLSILAREDGFIPHGKYSECIAKVHPNSSYIAKFIDSCSDFSESAILCGFNKTRIALNSKIRARYNYKGLYPNIGERIICLKNNKDAKACPIYNGVIGTLKSLTRYYKYLRVQIAIDGEVDHYRGKISPNSFNNEKPDNGEYIEGEEEEDFNKQVRFIQNNNYQRSRQMRRTYLDLFDFGYCLTVHKSQGSEWPRVMVVEQPCQYWSGHLWNKWLYTAVTRAKSELLIVSH